MTETHAIARVRGLDSIRFLCALWVFFGHGGGQPRLNPFDEGSLAHLALRGIYGNFWCGPAAVIVFFVISGFCIHYPQAVGAKPIALREFYIRRFVRLGLPVLAAIALSRLVGYHLSLFTDDILWSLVAELIYYALYPLLYWLRTQTKSWTPQVAIALVLALGVAATNPGAGNYSSYGLALNWLLGLPCWLMGCAIAESWATRPARSVSVDRIWILRGWVVGLAVLCSILRFHSPIGYPWTLNVFALAASYWLIRELDFRVTHAPPRLLESAGLWSYSLYLMHVPAMTLYRQLFGTASDIPFIHWAALVAFVFCLSVAFYVAVERPSHRLALRLSTWNRSTGPALAKPIAEK